MKLKSDRSGKFWFTVLVVMLLTSNLAAEEAIDYQGLSPGAGIELVLENCTVCHSADIILQNHMSREAWDETITWMQEKQGLWKLDKGDRKIILDYLSKAQGRVAHKSSRETIRKKGNPMYEFDYRPNPL